MWEKIKAFFSSKVTKVVAWVIFALDVVALLIGGATTAEIGDGVAMIAKIVAGIALFIDFITERVGKKS